MNIADRPTPLTDARVMKMLSPMQSGTEDVVRAEHARALEQSCEALIDCLMEQYGTADRHGRHYDAAVIDECLKEVRKHMEGK